MLMTEHAGKCLLKAHGVPVPTGALVRKSGHARRWSGAYPVALKAQVSSGGRGKAGGVVRASDSGQAEAAAQQLLEREFGGERPASLRMEPWVEHSRELYLAITVDGQSGGYVILYAPTGGVDVEHQAPKKYTFGSPRDFRAHGLRSMLAEVEPDGALRERIVALARRLLFVATAIDAVTVEINPLAVLPDGKLFALDAKIVRDESAAFRQADLADEIERARKREPRGVAKALAGNLMMVGPDGEVGLMSGGAGMTMAAMDLIADAGLKPACFLDCSSNPTPAGYQLAFEVLDAVLEVLDAGCQVIVYPGDGLPVQGAVELRAAARRQRVVLIGPDTPGVISPGKSELGFMPSFCYTPGSLGVISKSGSRSYEAAWRLTTAGLGQSTAIGIGGDPVKGLTAAEALELLQNNLRDLVRVAQLVMPQSEKEVLAPSLQRVL